MDGREDGLIGWELANLDEEAFSIEVFRVEGDCRNCPCLQFCSTPSESLRRLVPREGKLVVLGRERNDAGDRVSYFALIVRGTVRLIRLRETPNAWATASYVREDELPGLASAELARHAVSE